MTDLASLTPDDLRARGSQKWNRLPSDVIPLWIAEMDYPQAPAVLEAIHRTVATGGFGYAEVDRRVPEAFASFASRRLGFEVHPEWTTVLPDVLTGVELAIDVHSPAGSPVVVPTPSYMPFLGLPQLTGREMVPVALLEQPEADTCAERWALDLDAIERAFTEGARSIILCQPFNPVGRIFTAEELQPLAEIVARFDGWVVSDEIHAPLSMPGNRHLPYAAVSELAASHCSTVTSASKSFSIPGLPCATISHHTKPAFDRWTNEAPQAHIYGATTLGIEANIAAFTDGDAWLDEVMAQVHANQLTVTEWLPTVAPEARHTPAEATYLAWLDWRECGLADEPAEWFLQHAKVWMNPGSAFGEAGRGFTRLNLATTPAILGEALDRMGRALTERLR